MPNNSLSRSLKPVEDPIKPPFFSDNSCNLSIVLGIRVFIDLRVSLSWLASSFKAKIMLSALSNRARPSCPWGLLISSEISVLVFINLRVIDLCLIISA